MRIRQTIAAAAILLASAGAANAATYVVDAKANSSTGGTGLATLSLNAGQSFSVSSSTNDLWSLGDLPRWTDGNGLVANRLATASDDSGQPVNTLIGANYGTWSQNSLSAPYGSLVGGINGVYHELGANFSGTAWDTGTLYLYNWDSNSGDNFGTISFNVSAVPEPATWGMLLMGFFGVGFMMRGSRRREESAVA